LKHPFILLLLSLKGHCLPKVDKKAKLVSEHTGNGSLKTVLELGSKALRWWTVRHKVAPVIGIVL
jgi:hypothetical protein